MSRTISPGIVAIRICARCQEKREYLDLLQEYDTKLWVCEECIDQRDPYTLPPRQPDPIVIRFSRPDTQLTTLPVQQTALPTSQVYLPGPNQPPDPSNPWPYPPADIEG